MDPLSSSGSTGSLRLCTTLSSPPLERLGTRLWRTLLCYCIEPQSNFGIYIYINRIFSTFAFFVGVICS